MGPAGGGGGGPGLLDRLLLPLHPLHMLFNHFNVLISPLPGHDGYKAPYGGGSHFHYL